jgi:hypothetical protein
MKFTLAQARLFIASYCVFMTGLLLCFFLISPLFLPFNPGKDENVQLVQIILPVFLGYLGSASQFLFRSSGDRTTFPGDERLLFILTVGPCCLFFALNVVLFTIFYLQKTPIAEITKWFTMILSLLTSTVGVITVNLFATRNPPTRARRGSQPRGKANGL